MRLLSLLFLLTITPLSQAQPEKERLAFIGSFTEAVAAHDGDKVIAHLTESYVNTQLKEFLHNNKDQFLDELFTGMIADSEEWINLDFYAIDSIEFVELTETGNSSWEVIFKIKSGSVVFLSDLTLFAFKKKKKGKYKYGFEGAVG